MHKLSTKAIYLVLVFPLIPIMILYWLLEKLGRNKVLQAWESWAYKLAEKVTGR